MVIHIPTGIEETPFKAMRFKELNHDSFVSFMAATGAYGILHAEEVKDLEDDDEIQWIWPADFMLQDQGEYIADRVDVPLAVKVCGILTSHHRRHAHLSQC